MLATARAPTHNWDWELGFGPYYFDGAPTIPSKMGPNSDIYIVGAYLNTPLQGTPKYLRPREAGKCDREHYK